MKKLRVQIEIDGKTRYAGDIMGNTASDARFTYADSYLRDPSARPISLSLPLTAEPFGADPTRNFFDGLLPEGFTRRCVADYLHLEAADYLPILSALGRECLGAIQILEEEDPAIQSEYRQLSSEDVQKLAQEGAVKSAEIITKTHLSLTGASGKTGLYYDEKHQQWYLPIGNAPSTHIVKQSHVRLKKIVANEQLCLLTAKKLQLAVPDSFIVRTNGSREDILFATRRYDRKMGSGQTLSGLEMPLRLHQEDFAQALGIPAMKKYEMGAEGYLSKMFSLLRNYSASPMEDQQHLWDICVFNYLIGNTDNHIKNVSLLYSEDLKSIRLAPAYDIVSTVIYETSTERMALCIGGDQDIREINRESFRNAAAEIGLGSRMAMHRFDTLANRFKEALHLSAKELAQEGYEEAFRICEQIEKKGGIHSLL